MSSTIVFLDLLGTKESANQSDEAYAEAIDQLEYAIVENSDSIQLGDKIRVSSDTVFMEIGNPERALKFLSLLRTSLLKRQFYFKGAVKAGNYEIKEEITEKTMKDYTREKLENTCKFMKLGPQIVDLYRLQERYKGIGFLLHDSYIKLLSERTRSALVCTSGFFENEGAAQKLIVFNDIVFSHHDIGTIIDEIPSNGEMGHDEGMAFIVDFMKSCYRAHLKSNRYARYYIPTLLSIVKSSDFTKIYVDEEGNWRNFPAIFLILFIRSNIYKNFLPIRGFELLYLSCYQKLLQENKLFIEKIEGNIVPFFKEKKQLLSRMQDKPVSDFIISGSAYERLRDKIASIATRSIRRDLSD